MRYLDYKNIVIVCLLVLCSCQAQPREAITTDPFFDAALAQHVGKLKKMYVENNKTGMGKRLAVITFVNEDGEQSQLGRYVANEIQTKIFSPKIFELLERERIDSLLSEYQFSQSGLVNSVDTKKLGQLLGADLVLVGSIALNKTTKPQLVITSRIVDLEKGTIKAITSVKVSARPEYVEKYSVKLVKKRKDIAGIYSLHLSDLLIASRKGDGRKWDIMDSLPDVKFIFILSNSDRISSKIYYDKLSIKGKFYSSRIVLNNNDVVHLKIYDSDAEDDDLIAERIFSKEDILTIINAKEPVVLHFGQVESLAIALEEIVIK